jgi:hypothetical protein
LNSYFCSEQRIIEVLELPQAAKMMVAFKANGKMMTVMGMMIFQQTLRIIFVKRDNKKIDRWSIWAKDR